MNAAPNDVAADTRRRWLSWGARLAVAIVLVALILRSVDLGEFSRVVISPHWVPLGFMVVTAVLFLVLGAVKIWVLLGALAPLRLTTVLRYGMVAAALGAFTPAAVGDFSMVGFLRREGVAVHQGLSTMVVDRAITLAIYALIFLPLTLVLVIGSAEWLWVPGVIAVAVLAVLGLNLSTQFRRWLRERVVQRFAPRLEDFFKTFSDLLRVHPLRLSANVAVTFLRAIVAGAVIYCALLAAGTWADFFHVTVITNSLSLLNYIPISLGGVGVYEGGAVAVFSRLGLDSERVFAAFVFQRAYTVISSLLFLAFTRLVLPASVDAPSASPSGEGRGIRSAR